MLSSTHLGIISSALWMITCYAIAIIGCCSSTFIDVIKIIRLASIMWATSILGLNCGGIGGVWTLTGNGPLGVILLFGCGRGSSSRKLFSILLGMGFSIVCCRTFFYMVDLIKNGYFYLSFLLYGFAIKCVLKTFCDENSLCKFVFYD